MSTKHTKHKINSTPYPYLVIDDALPTDYYEQLEKEFDFNKIIENDRALNEYKENTAYRYNAALSLNDDDISSNWKKFMLSYKP